MKPRSVLLVPVSVLVLVSLACSVFSPSTPVPPVQTQAPEVVETEAAPVTPPSEEPTSLPPISLGGDVYAPQFAAYPVIPVEMPQTFAGGYTLPLNPSSISGLDGLELSEQQLALLTQNGFVVGQPVPGEYREFYQVYESYRYSFEQPIFATTDAVFHVYHLIFDKMLRDLERDYFIPYLEQLTSAMLAASQEQFQAVQGTSLEDAALRNVAFFAVAAQLLELPDAVPAEAQGLVDAELALIRAQGGPQESPIWDTPNLSGNEKLVEDYSQYIPRGHYTRSDALKRYFVSMMWYGRLTYRLRDRGETQRALLLVQALRGAKTPDGTTAVQLWQNIYEPTVFIVGKADDLSYFEYGTISDAVFGASTDPNVFADEAKMTQFMEAARALPPPQVNSMWVWIWEDQEEATQGFRFMGQRFTLDQYVFGQLIWRKVGDSENPRGLPKALDFFAAMGSDEALHLLEEMGENQYLNYSSQMEKVRNEVASLEQETWTQNLYWSWLYAFQPLIQPKDARYPAFMQTTAWQHKDLHTALASWTELKHDTILYAKQIMAEMGGGADEEPPHSYVEPNPEAYARLLALARMTHSGLLARGLLSEQIGANLENLMDLLQFMKVISEKELSGQTITTEEYWRILYFGGELEAMTIASADCDEGEEGGGCRNLEDQKAALIADVATGLAPDGSLVALEEGVGQPTVIFVVLPGEPYRVAVGAVFTYYEFPVPVDERMTDEEWQAQVESGTNPPAPAWTETFIAP